MIDVRPKAPRVPPVVVSKPSGTSVFLRVPTGLRSVRMPGVAPSGEVTTRDAVQLVMQIPPGVFAILPPAAPADYAAIPGAPVTGVLGSHAPFAQSQPSECDRVIPLAEFGGIRINLEEVIREIRSLGRGLRPLI